MIIDASVPMRIGKDIATDLGRVLAKQNSAKLPCPRCSVARALPYLRKNCLSPWPIHNTWATEVKQNMLKPSISPDFPYET